jgi:hypothetical protein
MQCIQLSFIFEDLDETVHLLGVVLIDFFIIGFICLFLDHYHVIFEGKFELFGLNLELGQHSEVENR